MVSQAHAGTGGVVLLPLSGTKVRSGLKVQIDTRWVEGTGYRPVRVRVSPIPPGPAAADRSIKITIRPRSWQMGMSRVGVTKTVELAQGTLFGDATLAVPHYEAWNSFEIETSEDGKRLRDLSVRGIGLPMRNYYNWSEAAPSILILDQDAPGNKISSNIRRAVPNANLLPDIRALAGRMSLNTYNGVAAQDLFNSSKSIDDSDILRLLTDLPRMEILPPEDLSDRWIDLSCVDIIMVSLDEVERIARERPATWRAIVDWQACGSTLCVFGVGDDYDRLAELEKHIEVSPLSTDARRPYARGWKEPRARGHSNVVTGLMGVREDAVYMGSTITADGGEVAPTKLTGPPGPKRFLIRDVRQGKVVAMGADNPFPGAPDDWAWLMNSLTQESWMWYRRHGISMHRENPEYWNLLIPGVGQAPVNSFLVLISLFVVVIGPINYFVLLRQKRLFLILVSVPAGAIVVTCSLVIYALLTDGLGVQQRTRSLTEIDQPSGHVAAWSRQSFYAGLAPSGGLLFPPDVVAYPVEHRPIGRAPTDRNNHLVWEQDGKQRLAEGFLTTRSTKQFLVVESRRTTVGLTIDEATNPPRVTNHLGATVDQLIVRDSNGDLFIAARLEPGATIGLAVTTAEDAGAHWSELLSDHRPAYPKDFDPYRLENAADFFVSYQYGRYVDQGLSDPSFASSVLERRLRNVTAARFRGLEPRSYLATTAQPVEVSVGVQEARGEAGFHLVIGRW